MPSPFPGMDPYLERQEWEDFHTTLNTVIRERLSPQLEPRYVVRVERRVYVEEPYHGVEELDHFRRADVVVLAAARIGTAVEPAGGVAIAPIEGELLMPQERRETYLVIRERKTMDVVTVIETLSPANKRRGGDGRREYLDKRADVISSRSHLVELDLLRGGERLPMSTPLPPGDYYAIVSRVFRRPKADVYPWSLRQPLPTIPIPLKRGDPDVPLGLQTVFTTVYDRARYDLTLDYAARLSPPLGKADAAWAKRLRSGKTRRRA
jgi:hypothetical protein